MTTRWYVDCPNCGGSGEQEGDCTCMDDTCCCLEPTPPTCTVCKGRGHVIVSQLSDDNYANARPAD